MPLSSFPFSRSDAVQSGQRGTFELALSLQLSHQLTNGLERLSDEVHPVQGSHAECGSTVVVGYERVRPQCVVVAYLPQHYASSMRGAEGIGTPPNEAIYQPKGETNRPDTGRHHVRFSYYVPHS